jgi:hypothetical protein
VNTEIFVASESDLSDDLLSNEPIETFPTLVSNGFYPMQLGVLMAILKGMDLSDTDAVEALCEDPLLDGGDKGPWVLRFPAETAEHLRGLDADEAKRLAARWWDAGDWRDFDIKKGHFMAWWNALLSFLREHAGTGQVYYWLDLR